MKNKIMMALFAGVCLFILPFTASARDKVGIIAIADQHGHLTEAEQMLSIVEGLGYNPEFIRENTLADPGILANYHCIIMSLRRTHLTEKQYETLAAYVKNGGTLFLTGLTAYWMIMDSGEQDKDTRRISGGGPLAEATGVTISPSAGIVKGFRVLEKNVYTEGLGDKFTYKTRPPYDPKNASNRHHTECYPLNLDGAKALMESEAYYEETNPDTGKRAYNMETPVTHAFLTVNEFGAGKTVWLACRAEILVLSRQEMNILRIINNVLKSSRC